MAFPKTVRLRQITIAGVLYRWRFQAGEMKGTLFIYGPKSSGTPLQIHSQDWFDLWLSWPYHNPKTSVLVAPILVRHIIEWALENGWMPEKRGAPMSLKWSHEEDQWRKIF